MQERTKKGTEESHSSVHYQLRKGYIILLVFMMVSVSFSAIALKEVGSRYQKAIQNYGFSQGYAGQLGIEFNAMIINLRNIILEDETDSMESVAVTIHEQQAKAEEYLALVESCITTDEEKQLVEQMRTSMQEYAVIRDQIVELAMANQKDEAYAMLKEEGVAPANVVRDSIDSFLALEIQQCHSMIQSANLMTNVLLVLIIIMEVVAIVIGLKLAASISKRICDPLEEIKEASEKLKDGQLDVNVTYEEDNEMGAVASSFREACAFMQEVIKDTERILKEYSDGNYHVKFEKTQVYKGDFLGILTSMEALQEEMSGTLQAIQDASNQVAAGAGQMASSAISLAEGATDQAGAVQELTASITTVSEMVEESAQSARDAYAQAKEYENEAALSGQAMEELTAAMSRINAVSKQIGNIIAEIEDIASQTNLLALNASIEAARAGEAGKGFAVVADQIGKLASESAKSAVDTRSLIENSVAEIEHGNQITERTSEELGKMIEGIRMLGDNAKLTNEKAEIQTDYMKQIQGGIEQISLVVQSNSAAAEETSATSEELSAQAVSLKEQMEKFQL